MAIDPPRYTVTSNQRTFDRLLALNRRAQEKGILGEWSSTMHLIFERLETEPEKFGDPLYRYKNLNLTVFRVFSTAFEYSTRSTIGSG